jgi:hypothetical protein
MIAVVQRLASLRRFTAPRLAAGFGAVGLAVAGLAMAVTSSVGGCTARSLLEVDVSSSDTDFQSVKLRLSAGGTSQDFLGATFTASAPYRAGLYTDASGTVTVVANVLDGSGKCIGAGSATLTGVAKGAASGATPLAVAHTTNCASVTTGAGGASGGSGGATGSGGSQDGSGGGSGSGSGGSGNGSGGSSGGTGGMNGGTGGSTSGGTNLVMNGDFSSGSNGWGLPAMMGQVSQMVTAGQFCVMVQQLSSATIGYPSGSVPPFQIDGGRSYTFSYQATSTGNLTIESKVGQTQTPYDATGSDFMNESVTGSLQTITHTFTRGTTDSSMGIAFNVTGGPGTFCIDNVSLTAN